MFMFLVAVAFLLHLAAQNETPPFDQPWCGTECAAWCDTTSASRMSRKTIPRIECAATKRLAAILFAPRHSVEVGRNTKNIFRGARKRLRALLVTKEALESGGIERAAPIAIESFAIPFSRGTLDRFFEISQPGAYIESPEFESCGNRWRLSLYPRGTSPSQRDKVGIYLRMLQGNSSTPQEVDASFSMRIQVRNGSGALKELGKTFRGGMTFTKTSEAGINLGRCENWGVSPCGTNELSYELERCATCDVVVELQLRVWDQRDIVPGAALNAISEQLSRVPSGGLRVGEVVVALRDGGSEESRLVSGAAYRIMRLCNDADEDIAFTADRTSKSDASVIAYMRPVEGSARVLQKQKSKWPLSLRLDQLPPLGSSVGPSSQPSRLAFFARTRMLELILLVLFALSPAVVTTQFGLYNIPSRSMQSTLRVGDAVLGEKISSTLKLPCERGDIVAFRPPPDLLQWFQEEGLGFGDLFIKRVAAVAGDIVEVFPNGKVSVNGVPQIKQPLACTEEYPPDALSNIRTGRFVVPKNNLFVLGDCDARSVDSRFWGFLPTEYVTARPFWRVLPFDRWGVIDEEDLNPFKRIKGS